MIIVLQAVLVICWAGLLMCFVLSYKNNITCKYCLAMIDAICKYRIECFDNKITPSVDYCDMKEYDKIFFCLWDWGYTRILPKDKFEIIKPYVVAILKKAKES